METDMKNRNKTSQKKLLYIILALALGVLALTIKNTLPSLIYTQSPLSDASLTGVYDTTDTDGTFYGKPVSSTPVEGSMLASNVLGTTTDNKRIEVDLTNQRIYAFEGNNKVYDFLISSGKWGRTPTGTFRIWTKLRYTRMKGGNKALGTFYDLPNVPYTMFFANAEVPSWRGFGIHGTYWHSNFGHPMSHGCINMKTEEVEKLYYWATPVLGEKPSIRATDDNPGTPVVIYGTAPAS